MTNDKVLKAKLNAKGNATTILSIMETSEININIYLNIRETLVRARTKVISAINFAMVEAYWEIGRQITEVQGERAEYGKKLLKYLSQQLTAEFGSGFTERNLRAMRQFYLTFPIRHTLCAELSWSHYRLIMQIDDIKRRDIFI